MSSKYRKVSINTTSLLSLDDHCLLHVFGFMKIRDVVNAEQTCTRLQDIAKLYYRTTKTLEWTADLPFASASKIICKFGCFSTSLHSLRFHNIEKPTISNVNATKAYQHFIDTLLDNCKNIKSLTFIECDVSGEWAPFFDALQFLDSLSLFQTNLRKSSYLRRVSTLKQFTLVGTVNFTQQTFIHFLYNNRRLSRLVLKDCEDVSMELFYELGEQRFLERLSVEVHPKDIQNAEDECVIYDCDGELVIYFQNLKKLQLTQAKPDLNLNIYLKKMTENAALDELELFKVNVDEDILATLNAIKLTTLKLYPRIKTGNVSSFCHMLVDAMSNLKRLTLMLFDPDRDTDISDDDLLMLIERLPQLESLNLYHCECECNCDYIVCPFRCKLRALIGNINEIFNSAPQRPNMKFVLPKRMTRTYFDGKLKIQQKYRRTLTDRVQFVRIDESYDDDFLNSIFNDFLDDLSTDNEYSEDALSMTSDPESDDDWESGDDSESDA